MDYELNDQDRADLVRNFFKRFGWWIALIVVLIGVGFGVNSYLHKRTHTENANASIAYQAMLASAQHGATTMQLTESAKQLIQLYPKSVYATFAELMLAKFAVESNDLKKAAGIISDALQQNKDNSLTPILKMRLARVLIADKQYADAIKILDKAPKGFVAPFALLSGDAELADGNAQLAKISYLAASKANRGAKQPNPILSQLLAERLNSLGGIK